MSIENRKVVLIGTGLVGMSYAYALLNQNACNELVLIDCLLYTSDAADD